MLSKRCIKAFILEKAENEEEVNKADLKAYFFRKILRKSLCKINFVLNLHPHLSIGLWCNWQHVWFWSRRV